MEIKLGYVLKSGNLFFRGFNVGNNDNLFVMTNEFELALQMILKRSDLSK